MGPVDRLRSAIRGRHVHLVALTFFLINGIYLQVTGGLEPGNLHLAHFVVMGFFLLAIPLLIVCGWRTPWHELRLTVGLGFLFWTSVSLLAGMIAVALGLPSEPEVLFSMFPGGMLVYAVLIGVAGSNMVLAMPFSLRYVYRKLTGSGGDGGGRSTPEEQVLSEEELEDWDHPMKKLRQFLAFLVSPITDPNRIGLLC